MIQIKPASVATELPIFACDLSFVQPQLALARAAIDELRVTHPQSPESNVKAAYMSPWQSHLLNQKMRPLADAAVTIGHEVSKSYLSANLKGLNMDLVVTDCWG